MVRRRQSDRACRGRMWMPIRPHPAPASTASILNGCVLLVLIMQRRVFSFVRNPLCDDRDGGNLHARTVDASLVVTAVSRR
jgi:hypothetical protein